MAQITLGSNESFTVSGGTNTISGTTGGSETVTINGGVNVFTADFNAGGDRVILAGSASQYTVTRSGSSIVLAGPNGTTVTFPAPNPNLPDAQNPRITFANNGTPQDFVFDSTTAGVFTVTPTGGTAQTVTTTPATVTGGTVTPPPPTASVSVSVANGTEGGANIVYTFTLSAAQSSAVTLNVATTGGTATVGSDYTPVSTAVTFAPGQTTQFLTVNVIDDTVVDSATTETVVLSITAPAGITAPATVQATITDNESAPIITPGSFQLTTGSDTVPPSGIANPGDDRISGVQDTTQPGKLLSQTDKVDGGASSTSVTVTTLNGVQTFSGGDLLELFNAPNPGNANTVVPNVLDDVDLSQTRNVERLESNYNQITLGAAAAASGIRYISTIQSDTRGINIANAAVANGGNAQYQALAGLNGNALTTGNVLTQNQGQGVLLDITSAFTGGLNAQLSNGSVDLVRISLDAAQANGAGNAINTGGSITTVAGATISPIDQVVLTSAGSVLLSLASGQVGDGNTVRAGTSTLAITAQTETGGVANSVISTFDDEGIQFTGAGGATFHVVDPFTTPGTTVDRGAGFVTAIFGNLGDDTFAANGRSYINGGSGNDTITGSGAADVLVGGAGNDVLTGGFGADTLIGGGGNDIYGFGESEFTGVDTVTEAVAGGIDYLAISQSANVTDANFTGLATGASVGQIEGIAVNLNGAAVGNLSADSSAAATGISTFVATNDTVNITAGYTLGATIYTFGRVAISSGNLNDIVVLQGTNPLGTISAAQAAAFASQSANASYNNIIATAGGNDTVYAGYALQGAFQAGTVFGAPVATTAIIDADGGTDELVIGGLTNGFGGSAPAGNSTYAILFGADITNFETLTINNAGANASVAYRVTLNAANVVAGGNLTVNASSLRAANVATNLAAETFTFDASALIGANVRTVTVTGGAADDSLTGGNFNDTLNGGAGADTLNGGAGNDIIRGGVGADIITGGAGDDNLDGEGDNDTYLFINDLTATDTVNDTGNSTDTLGVTQNTGAVVTDAQFALKTSVEVLTTNVSGGATVQNDATPAGAPGLFEVTVGTAAAAAGIRTVNAGNDDVSAAAFNVDGLTINIGGAVNGQIAFTSNAGNVTGSGFADIVNIDVTTLYAATGNISLGAGNDVLVTGFSLADAAVANGAAGTATLDGGTGNNDEIRIGGEAGAGGAQLNTVFGANFGTATFDFGNAAGGNFTNFELLTILPTSAGTPAAPGVATDFVVNFSAANVLGVGAGGYFTVNASQIGGVINGVAAPNNTQQLTLNAATVATALDVTGGSSGDTITTGTGADRLIGGAGNDTLTGGAGFDNYQGGDGDDVIALSVVEFNNDADQIDGGEGAESTPTGPLNTAGDTLLIRGTQNLPGGIGNPVQEIADVGFSTRIVANTIEQITLEGIVGGNTAFNYTAGFYSQAAGVNVINVGDRASNTTVSIENYTVGGVTLNDVITTTNATTFRGSAQNDTFNLGLVNSVLGGGTDIVRAGAGVDAINFGSTLTGADIVDGGAGADTLQVSGDGVVGTTFAQTINMQATGGPGNTTVTAGIFSIETLNLASGGVFADNTAPTNDVAGSVSSYVVNVSDSTFDGAAATLTINGSTLRSGVILTLAGGQSATTGEETLTVNGSNVQTNFTTGAAVLGNGGTTAAHSILATGGAANDTLVGGSVADTLNGGAGNDRISGGDGADTLDGGAGADEIFGGAGNDGITGGLGADLIDGGAGVDTINLGADGARDTVLIGAGPNGTIGDFDDVVGDAARGAVGGPETLNGFQTGTVAAGVFTATADVINFGVGLINGTGTVGASIAGGVVVAGSTLQANLDQIAAVFGDGGLLQAIQLVEQEINGVSGAQTGVLAFRFNGSTYLGEISDTDPNPAAIQEAFTDIVKVTGVTGVTALFDVDGAGAGTAFGLQI